MSASHTFVAIADTEFRGRLRTEDLQDAKSIVQEVKEVAREALCDEALEQRGAKVRVCLFWCLLCSEHFVTVVVFVVQIRCISGCVRLKSIHIPTGLDVP
jgi:hypothetical protein